jgi:CheY-like chemotaxis protein
VCADEAQLAPALAEEPKLGRDGPVVCVLAASSAAESARGADAIRRVLSDTPVRIVGACFGPEPTTADETRDVDGWVLRPLGAARLRQALRADSEMGAHGAPTAPNPGQALPDLSGARVLLAEDNPVGQMVVSDMLRAAGASCDTANNGNEVLAAVHRSRYDLILMDCFMPELDGFETTRRIRELQREGKLRDIPPIIALTAKAMRGDRESCLEAGMNGYISKPIDERELLRTVAEHTGRSGVRGPKAAPRERPNLAALRARFGGKSEVFTKLLQAYRDTTAEDLGRIDRALESHDASMLEHAAHRLAGGAGFVSAETVRRLARELEGRAVAQQLDDLAESARQLRLEVAESIRDLEEVTNPRETHQDPATVLGKE